MIIIIMEDEPCGCKAPLGKRLAPEKEWGSRPPSSANPQAILFQICILGALAGLINISGGNDNWENYVAIISPFIIGYALWPTSKEKNLSVK
jgi:hypothetical protein